MLFKVKRAKNKCHACRYTWYPRGKNISSKCPNCGSFRVDTLDGTDAIVWLFIALGVGISVLLFLAFLKSNPVPTVIVIVLAGALYIINKNRKLEQEKERLLLLANAEQQRIAAQQQQYLARQQYLLNKFDDPVLVQRIFNRSIQLGDSRDVILEAFGPPISVDSDILKTSIKETFKYKKGNENRQDQYSIQIKLENGYVVGWEDKN